MTKKTRKAKQLKYFLDHPQIKRAKSPGNGTTPKKVGLGAAEGFGSTRVRENVFSKMAQESQKPVSMPKVEKKGSTLRKAQNLSKKP